MNYGHRTCRSSERGRISGTGTNADFKSEYFAGETLAISAASRRHNVIAGNIFANIWQRLRAGPCTVYSSDLRVAASPAGLYTYPDVVVTCGAEQFHDQQFDTLLNPAVIIEVLSESTKDFDRGQKFESYRALDSLKEYLTVAQDLVHVEHYSRQEDGRWMLAEFNDPSAIVVLASINVELSVADIYEKVDLA